MIVTFQPCSLANGAQTFNCLLFKTKKGTKYILLTRAHKCLFFLLFAKFDMFPRNVGCFVGISYIWRDSGNVMGLLKLRHFDKNGKENYKNSEITGKYLDYDVKISKKALPYRQSNHPHRETR